MIKIDKVRRCLRLPPNRVGRDLVVGDLHGHRSLFEAVARLAERLATLPLAIHVEGEPGFNVTHADLSPAAAQRSLGFEAETVEVDESEMLALPFSHHSVQISPPPRTRHPLTYAGHSPLRHVTVHNSHVYIDQGVSAGSSKRGAAIAPTVLDHRLFAYWLDGVTQARRRATAAALRRGPGPRRFSASVALA